MLSHKQKTSNTAYFSCRILVNAYLNEIFGCNLVFHRSTKKVQVQYNFRQIALAQGV